MKTPCVSVCIVAYNHENYIHNCVMSAISQAQDVPVEILIGDDLSDDKTASICERLEADYPELIRFFRHKNKFGPSGNYQYLIEKSQGKYISHLDGDDFFLPGKLKHQISTLEANSNLSAVYTNALCINDSGDTVAVFNNKQPETFDQKYLLRKGNFLNHSSMMYRSEYKSTLIKWKEEFIDYKIHLYLASQGYLGYINRLYVGYRVSSTSSMIAHQGDSVRSRYWDALQYSRTLISDDVYIHSAEADFLRRALSRAIRTKSPSLIWKWAVKVFSETKQERFYIFIKLIAYTAVTAVLETTSLLCARVNGSRVRVMYWR